MPARVIHRDQDRFAHPEESIALWRDIKDSKLCILPNFAHNVHL